MGRCVVGGEEELVGFDAEANNVAALEVVGSDAGLGVLEGVGAWRGQGPGALEGEARAGGYGEGGALKFDVDAVPGAHWGSAKGVRVLGGGVEVGALELGFAHEEGSEGQVTGVGGEGLAAFFDAGRDVYGAAVEDAGGVGWWGERGVLDQVVGGAPGGLEFCAASAGGAGGATSTGAASTVDGVGR